MAGGLIQLLFLFLFLVPYVFFIITLYNTLVTIKVENRKMPPGQVWLLLVPLFNLLWMFVVVNKLATSIKQECDRLFISYEAQTTTKDIGNIFAVLAIVSFFPVIGFFFGLGGFVCWIIYWMKVAQYRKLFIANKDNALLDIEKA